MTEIATQTKQNNQEPLRSLFSRKGAFLFLICWIFTNMNGYAQTCCPDFVLKDLIEICPPAGACHEGGNADGHHQEAILAACMESLHTYTVYPNDPLYTYEWAVVGGTPTSFTGNPIDIVWGNGTTGFITVVITGVDGCEEIFTEEVCLVDGPEANFSFQPDPTCVNTPVNFTNLSIGGDVFFWDFGDGNTSNGFNTVHSYDQPGFYEVTLTVTDFGGSSDGDLPSACGCSDSITFTVEVQEGQGPVIESDCCDGTVCPGETSTFYTSTVCNDYIWTVTGGTVIAGQGTNEVVVEWDATYSVPTSVSLETPNCGTAPCAAITTINVPVLYPNLPINGPVNLCESASGNFTLPKLPGTYYTWTVTGGNYNLNLYDENTNQLNVSFQEAGTFEITAEYDNPLAGCDGLSSITVEVKPIFRLFSVEEDLLCEDTKAVYFTNGNVSNWSVSPSGPTIDIIAGDASEISWDTAGTYIITAEAANPGDFCNPDAMTQVEVVSPPQLDPIDGPTVVCPDTYLTYFISSDTEGSDFIWTINPPGSGTIFSEMGADKDSIVVAFQGAGPWTIEVYQEIEIATGQNCTSDVETITIEAFDSPSITSQSGNTEVCVDAVETYFTSLPVPQGGFTWEINPPNRGTIVSGQGTEEVEIRWHGPPANATLSVSSCAGSDQIAIEIVDPPFIDWIFPDGPTLYCLPDTPSNLTLSTSLDPNFTYQWYLDGLPIPGATGHEYTITSLSAVPQEYLYEVVASNGSCTKTRERLVVIDNCVGDPPPPFQCDLDFTFTPEPACVGQPVSFNATSFPPNYDFAWEFGDNSTSFTQNTKKAFNTPGIYEVTLTGTWFDQCSLVVVKQVEVNPLPSCEVFATDTIFCPGDSLMLEACQGMDGYQWYREGNPIPGATQQTYWATQHGLYQVEATNQFGCSDLSEGIYIFTHALPRAKISGEQSICVNANQFVNINLSTLYDDDYSYDWSSNLAGVGFTANGSNAASETVAFFPAPSPLPTQVEFYVSVTNLITGCVNTDTLCLSIFEVPPVTMDWIMECEGDSYTLTPSLIDTSQYHYQWSNGASTPEITVTAAGSYSLIVTDKNTGCATFPLFAAFITPKPDLSLFPTGCETLMIDEVLELYLPLPLNSSSWANTYPMAYPSIEWFDVNNNLLGTGQSFNFSSSAPGYFEVYAIVENFYGCSETSVVFCITVEGDFDDPEPEISVTKNLDNINGTDQAAFTQEGDVLTYNIVVCNTGNVTLSNVVVEDPLTGLNEFIQELAPGDCETFTTSYTITVDDLNHCEVVNVVNASGSTQTGTQVTDTDEETVPCEDPFVPEPGLTVTKTLSDINGQDNQTAFTQVGDVLNFVIVVTNTGNVPLTDVLVDDPVTGDSWTISVLNPGDSETFTTTYIITQGNLDSCTIRNFVTATGDDPDGNQVSDGDVISVPCDPEGQNPDISVTKNLDNINGTNQAAFTQEGDVLTYNIVVCNTGNVTLSNVVVEDPLTGLNEFIQELAPGDCETFTTSYTITVDDLNHCEVVNVVNASGSTQTGTQVTDTDEETVPCEDPFVPEPGLTVTKTLSDINGQDNQTAFTQVGDVLNFVIVVTNTGNVPLTNVLVDDPVTGDSWTIPVLNPGDSETFTTTYVITQGDLDVCALRNVVIVSGTDPDGNQVGDMDVISIPCDHEENNPGVSIQKTLISINDNPDQTTYSQVGDILIYALVITNTGNVTLTNLTVNDPFTGFSTTIATLAPGDSVTFTTSYTIQQADIDNGFFNNRASVSGVGPDGTPIADTDFEIVEYEETEPALYDFGDAPEGVLAYPPFTMGFFPTCTNTGPTGSFVRHSGNHELFFGEYVDYETDGNAGFCPTFSPNLYDQDECFQDGDAGLIRPRAYTIIGNPGNETVVPCVTGGPRIPWFPCRWARWRTHIDIHVTNNLPGGAVAYANLLIDWDQDGEWGGSSICRNMDVPEHVLVNFEIPNGFSGPLSDLSPPNFRIGPNRGYIWTRFTVSETPVPANWNGAGDFNYGETEDYLLHVRSPFLIVDAWDLIDIVVPLGVDTCFSATQTIRLGGEAPFVVEDGGSVDLRAGRSIRMLEGVKVEAGGFMHARIVTDPDDYCFVEELENTQSQIINPIESIENKDLEITESDKDINIYPNPTNGQLTLELLYQPDIETIRVEIFNMMGEKILITEVPAEGQHVFDLSGQPKGIYFIRVIDGQTPITKRIIRH